MTRKTLKDDDIRTRPAPGRRRVLGLIAAGAAGLAGPAQAQGVTDADDGAWADRNGCGRGAGGTYSGLTDQDDGAITDSGGYGRGEPGC
ncbi:hypothetical protein HKCCE2091_13100 [Rhodobacterales bacterium HKCCE2091]|nr:hypothetical protein [Rhodobacterales bacterium HKCCE2091]